MTESEVREYISEKLHWIPSTTEEVTLERYYEIIDDFSSMLINNLPRGLR